MFMFELNIFNVKSIQLVKDFTSDHARKSDEFYSVIATISEQHYYHMVSLSKLHFKLVKLSTWLSTASTVVN